MCAYTYSTHTCKEILLDEYFMRNVFYVYVKFVSVPSANKTGLKVIRLLKLWVAGEWFLRVVKENGGIKVKSHHHPAERGFGTVEFL